MKQWLNYIIIPLLKTIKMNLDLIKKEIVPQTYECDKCGENGNQTNMRLIIGVGLFHCKCLN